VLDLSKIRVTSLRILIATLDARRALTGAFPSAVTGVPHSAPLRYEILERGARAMLAGSGQRRPQQLEWVEESKEAIREQAPPSL
jgi:hypothetical protein